MEPMLDTRNLNKTELAICGLLLENPGWLDFDAIYSFLNPTAKVYSYAAIYKNIRSLQQKEILLSRKIYPYKKDYFCFNPEIETVSSNKVEETIYNNSK